MTKKRRAAGLWGRLKRYWGRRPVRVTVVVCVMGAAAYLQYYLASLPRAVDVTKGPPPVAPATARFKQESVVILGPEPPGGGDLLTTQGRKNETVDFSSPRARLSDDTYNRLAAICQPAGLPLPPKGFVKVEYESESPEQDGDDAGGGTPPRAAPPRPPGADTCHMGVTVKAETPPPSEIELRQAEAGSGYSQVLELTARSAAPSGNAGPPEKPALLVMLSPSPPLDRDTEAPGCGKTLSLGDWKLSVGPLNVAFVVPDGVASQFSFQTTSPDTELSTQGGYFVPFTLGGSLLKARGLRKTALPATTPAAGEPTPPPALEVETVGEAKRLSVESVQLKDNELRVGFSGEGMVKQDGAYTSTFSVIDPIKNNPLLGGLFVLLNTTLIGWFTYSLKKPKAEKPQTTPDAVVWAWLRRYRKPQAERITEAFLAAGYSAQEAPKAIRKAIAELRLVRPEHADGKKRDALEETANAWADQLSAWAAAHPAGRRRRAPEKAAADPTRPADHEEKSLKKPGPGRRPDQV